MKIILQKERPISWNVLYSGRYWNERREMVKTVKETVGWELKRMGIRQQKNLFEGRVTILITAYFKNSPLDPDNIFAKPYIDALKEFLIRDDSRKYIHSVTTVSEIDRKDPRVEIDVIEIDT